MTKIIDVILHKNKYYTQRFLVIDRYPDLKYQELFKGGRRILFAKDGIFSGLYYYERPSENCKAFAGRKFEIPMVDGTVTEASGQWWHGHSSKKVISVGIGTPDGLGKCNVFSSHEVDKEIAEQVFSNFNNVSNNYNKYNDGHSDYGKNIIISPWD